MIFEKYLIPDYVAENYKAVTVDLVKKMGGEALICDIDNTLVTYDDPEPTPELINWFEEMKKGGVTVCFVSNNEKERAELFNKKLGFIAYGKARKPSTKFLRAAVNDLKIQKEKAILLGDQLLTDCAAAKLFGIKAIIVPPIKDKTTLFFKTKRLIEVPYMKKYKKMHEKNEV